MIVSLETARAKKEDPPAPRLNITAVANGPYPILKVSIGDGEGVRVSSIDEFLAAAEAVRALLRPETLHRCCCPQHEEQS